MSTQRIAKLNHYFDNQISLCGQRNQTLLADDRTDEATFEKIKANVYDIFRTILSVAVETGKDDSEAVRRFFLLKAEQIPSSWEAAYQKAKRHDNAVDMRIEQIKLDTIKEIRETFTKIWEGEV